MSTPHPAEPPPRRDFGRVAHGLRWTLLGEVGFAGGQFALLVLLAHLGSEPALGRYSLGLAIVTPLLVITSLHLRPAYVIVRDEDLDFSHYLTLRTLAVPLSVLIAAAWAWLATEDLRTVWVVIAVGIMRGAELFSDIFYAPAQRAEQLHPIGVSRALRGLVLVASAGAALALGLDPAVAITIGAGAAVVLTLSHDRALARRHAPLRLSAQARPLWALAVRTAPIGIAGGLLGLSVNMPAYLLEAWGGVTEVGRYAAIFSVFYISGVLNAALGGAAIARLARLFESDRRGFLALLARLVALVAGLGALGVVACQWLGPLYLRLAYGASYVGLVSELEVAALAAAIAGVANLLSQALVVMHRFKTQLLCNIGVLGLSVGLAAWLVPERGVAGAARALVALSLVRLVIYLATVAVAWRRSACPPLASSRAPSTSSAVSTPSTVSTPSPALCPAPRATA
ncbi:MAG: lipopolysaccharide biosynthesis protein [Myxococcales bacterium]|nr:lipopolysaccharide biosynthesis protein [Myxococcales bacterium]